jgi:hypothetical protein
MTVVGMIKEWRKGCSCSNIEGKSCHECSVALIEAIEKRMSEIPQSRNQILLTKAELDEFMHDWKLER